MKSLTRKTKMDVRSPLRSRRLILLLTTVLLGGGSPCTVVNSIKTASGAASINATPNRAYEQYCNPAVVNYLIRDEMGKLLTKNRNKNSLRTAAEGDR